jgi:hypothetical protein
MPDSWCVAEDGALLECMSGRVCARKAGAC